MLTRPAGKSGTRRPPSGLAAPVSPIRLALIAMMTAHGHASPPVPGRCPPVARQFHARPAPSPRPLAMSPPSFRTARSGRAPSDLRTREQADGDGEDCDVFLGIPILKSHGFCGMTGGAETPLGVHARAPRGAGTRGVWVRHGRCPPLPRLPQRDEPCARVRPRGHGRAHAEPERPGEQGRRPGREDGLHPGERGFLLERPGRGRYRRDTLRRLPARLDPPSRVGVPGRARDKPAGVHRPEGVRRVPPAEGMAAGDLPGLRGRELSARGRVGQCENPGRSQPPGGRLCCLSQGGSGLRVPVRVRGIGVGPVRSRARQDRSPRERNGGHAPGSPRLAPPAPRQGRSHR